MGPVEEFLTDGMGLGYAEAKAGGTFLKIGVGVIRKPDEPRFQQFHTYEIVDNGKWSVEKHADSIEFTQTVTDPTSGYAYVYSKTVKLVAGKPELVLEHRLKNTGTKPIESDVYEHNFYVLDKQPVGPDTVVRFPFDVHAAGIQWLRRNQRARTRISEGTAEGTFGAERAYRLWGGPEGLRHHRREHKDRSFSSANLDRPCPDQLLVDSIHGLPGGLHSFECRSGQGLYVDDSI